MVECRVHRIRRPPTSVKATKPRGRLLFRVLSFPWRLPPDKIKRIPSGASIKGKKSDAGMCAVQAGRLSRPAVPRRWKGAPAEREARGGDEPTGDQAPRRFEVEDLASFSVLARVRSRAATDSRIGWGAGEATADVSCAAPSSLPHPTQNLCSGGLFAPQNPQNMGPPSHSFIYAFPLWFPGTLDSTPDRIV